MRPERTVLDAELSLLAKEARSLRALRNNVPLVALGNETTPTADIPAPSERRVSLKIVTAPGKERQVSDWILEQGGSVISSGKHVLIGELPTTALKMLDGNKLVRRAEAPRRLRPCLDEARGPATGLEAALQTVSRTGDNVVIGVIDSGVDWQHVDFRQPNGSSRLEYFGHYHRPDGSQVSTFSEFSNQDINEALQGTSSIPQGDPHGHGTHCASIAAGNGAASGGQFKGVAPHATLMAVRSEPLLDTHIIRGIREIFQRAGDRPAVINLSLGGHLGAHDGTSAIENVIAQESGPGRIIVVAAGNERTDQIHWKGELQLGQDLIIPVHATDPDLQFVDVWIPRGDDVDVKIETPDGNQFIPEGTEVNTPFGAFLADWRQDPINHDQNLTLLMAAGDNSTWKIRISPHSILHGEVHAWGGTTTVQNVPIFPNFTEHGHSIGMPGTEERAVSVGSFVSRTSFTANGGLQPNAGLSVGQLSSFSSLGPTRIGLHKPDIAGPGQFITAALSAGSVMATDPKFSSRLHPSGQYITIQGTSMATPFIAGVIALILEQEPHLTPEEIQQRLRTTARRDDHTQRVWNEGFGFGKIDVEALLTQ